MAANLGGSHLCVLKASLVFGVFGQAKAPGSQIDALGVSHGSSKLNVS